MSEGSDTGKPEKELAIALKYDGSGAPRVTAKGRGYIADDIIALAEKHDIPIQDKPELVQILAQIDIGDEIPENLYVAVAEIIAFAFLLKGNTSPTDNEETGVDDLLTR